jgi:hypothetical protein
VASSQSKGRYPFSRPPLARPALVSRDGVSTSPPPIKSYMLMVGYNQVQLDNLLQSYEYHLTPYGYSLISICV